MTPGACLRAAWSAKPIMIPGAFNALVAKMAERLGYKAVYLSGGALSAGWAGLPDIGLLTQSEFAEPSRGPRAGDDVASLVRCRHGLWRSD